MKLIKLSTNVVLLLLIATHLVFVQQVNAQRAGLDPNISEDECDADVKAALANPSAAESIKVLRDVACWASTGADDNCPTAATFYSDCNLCCPPDAKPKADQCMKWKDELGEGDFCGHYGYFRSEAVPADRNYVKVASCTEDYICNGNINMESYHTCYKKESLRTFDCLYAANRDGSDTSDVPRDLLSIIPLAVASEVASSSSLLQARAPTLNCGHYIHRGEPLFCKISEDGQSGRCEEMPKPGDSCDEDADYEEQCGRNYNAHLSFAPGVEVNLLQNTYSSLLLGEMRTHRFPANTGTKVFEEEDPAIRMKCDSGKCRFLRNGEECDPDLTTAQYVCGWGYKCKNNKDDIYAYGENDDAETKYTCQLERIGTEKCGYPGLGCTASTYCDSVPNMKTDDARQPLFNAFSVAGIRPFHELLLRCGVFCEGKMSKIDFRPADGSPGDCVCTGSVKVDEDGVLSDDKRERCKFDDVFQDATFRSLLENNYYLAPESSGGLGLSAGQYAMPAASTAEEDCPNNAETAEALEDYEGKTGTCLGPNFINEEHKRGNPCFVTGGGNRACESKTPPPGPDVKCNFDGQCVDRSLGIVGLVKRLGLVEDIDFGESCKYNPEDPDDNDEDCDCACGPDNSGSSGVCRNSEAPNIQGSSPICSGRLVFYARCLRDNQCSQRYTFAFTSDPLPIQEDVGNCGSCRSELKTLAIDCLRPSAVASTPEILSSRIPPISAYFYYGGVYVYGGRFGGKNELFIGAFFGVFFALCLLIGGCCYACKKVRDKKRAARDEDGNKKSNAVVPKQDV